MHLHAAMSPLSKSDAPLSPIKGYGNKFLFNTNIENPLAEKAGIVQHKTRLDKINNKMHNIQNLYSKHTTLAQYTKKQLDTRDVYYQNKMVEAETEKHLKELEKIKIHTKKRAINQDENMQLVRQRS